MTEKKKNNLLFLAKAIKGFTGTIGMSALIVDYKWIGITVLCLGAMANEYINYATKSNG
jgi:hypothetical protein